MWPFNKSNVQRGRLALSPTWLQDFFRRYTFLALLALSVIAGIMFGATVAYQASMTQEAQEVAGLASYRPNLVTRVMAGDGKTVVGEFSLERRIPITYDQIPETMKKAIFAIEDDRFYQHIGVDPIRIVSATFKNIVKSRKAEGASTLTQQLARAALSFARKDLHSKDQRDSDLASDRAILHQRADNGDVLQPDFSGRRRLRV